MKYILLLCLLITQYTITAQTAHSCAEGRIQAALNLSHKTTVNSAMAIRLMPQYDIHHYDIDLVALVHDAGFTGDVTVTAEAVTTMDTLCFQLSSSIPCTSVDFNQQTLPAYHQADEVIVPLPSSLSSGDVFRYKVSYAQSYTSGNFFNGGMNKGQYFYTVDTVLASFSAPYTMKEWLPAKEMLYDKIDSVDIRVETELDYLVGANGVLINKDTLNGHSYHHWKTKYPIDYYLISVAVSDYMLRETHVKPNNLPGDSILVQNFIFDEPVFLAYLTPNLDSNDKMLKYYSETFGLYPFASEKYGNCFAPLGGGMEHQTMTTIGVLSTDVLSHELAHQWFGDLVTCSSLSDISINEGFASYGEILTSEHLRGVPAAIAHMADVHDLVKQQLGGSVYCTDTTDIYRLYSHRLTYNKGSAVLGTLRYILGDSLFFGGVTQFLQNHAYGVASFYDLKSDMEAYSGANLDDYFDQWIYGEGYPKISARYNQVPGQVYVQLSQVTSVPSSVSFFKGPIDIELQSSTGAKTLHRVDWHNNGQLFAIPYTDTLMGLQIDPNYRIVSATGNIAQDTMLSLRVLSTDTDIQVYPNPVANTLRVKGAVPHKESTQVYDAQGKQIRVILEDQVIKMPAGMQPGVYFLQVGEQYIPFTKR